MTIDRHSWGFRRVASLSDYLSMNDIIQNLTSTVSCGGKYTIIIILLSRFCSRVELLTTLTETDLKEFHFNRTIIIICLGL